MSRRRSQGRIAGRLLAETGAASAEVIATRLVRFADPTQLASARQQREATRMVSEKAQAAGDGLFAAWWAMAMLPWQLMRAAPPVSTRASADWTRWWTIGAELWTGVGNAALRPSCRAAVANRARLRKS